MHVLIRTQAHTHSSTRAHVHTQAEEWRPAPHQPGVPCLVFKHTCTQAHAGRRVEASPPLAWSTLFSSQAHMHASTRRQKSGSQLPTSLEYSVWFSSTHARKHTQAEEWRPAPHQPGILCLVCHAHQGCARRAGASLHQSSPGGSTDLCLMCRKRCCDATDAMPYNNNNAC